MPISFDLKYQRVGYPRLRQAFAKIGGIVDEAAVDLMDDISGFKLTILR